MEKLLFTSNFRSIKSPDVTFEKVLSGKNEDKLLLKNQYIIPITWESKNLCDTKR